MLKKKSLFLETLCLGSSSILVTGLNFIFYSILSRFVSIDFIGLLNTTIGQVIIIMSIAQAGIPARIMHISSMERVEDISYKSELSDLVRSLIYTSIFSGFLFFILKIFYNYEGYKKFDLLLISGLIIIYPFCEAIIGYLYGKKKSIYASLIIVIEPLIRIIIIFLLVFLLDFKNFSIGVIFLIYLFSYLINLISGLSLLCKKINFKKLLKIYRDSEYSNFNLKIYFDSIPYGIPSLYRNLIEWFPIIFLSIFTNPFITGIYFCYSKISSFLCSIPLKIFEGILVPRLYIFKDANIKSNLKYIFIFIMIIISISKIFVPIAAEFFINLSFPIYSKYLISTNSLSLLSFAISLKIINFSIEYIYIIRQKAKKLTLIKIWSLFAQLILLPIFLFFATQNQLFSDTIIAINVFLCIELISFSLIIFPIRTSLIKNKL